jgi:pilus assembly protein CpaB
MQSVWARLGDGLIGGWVCEELRIRVAPDRREIRTTSRYREIISMGRRTVLLLVAALIAALGTSMVFMYVRGVEARAAARFDAVEVLEAVEVIPAGETLEAAQAAGKIQMRTVLRDSLLEGATTSVADMATEVALTTVYPGEQIITGKFGSPGEQEVLTIPDGQMAISVNLTDPARVAGFVTPGAEVAIFVSAEPEETDGAQTKPLPDFTRLLLPRVQVIGVGTTTVVPTTTTDETGAQKTEELPRTLLTLAVDQGEAEKVIFAAKNGELAFALLTEKSQVEPGPPVTADNIFRR